MSEVDGLISRYQELVETHLERYHRAVEESDAAEISSFLTVLVYQHLEAKGQIERFLATRYQDVATIAAEARRLVEQKLFTSVDRHQGDLTLLVVAYAMVQVNWLAVAEVILDEIADRRTKLQCLGGQEPRHPG